jgi:hypothetical protein
VGREGKIGALTLLLEQDQERRKTAVKEQYSKVPFFIQSALGRITAFYGLYLHNVSLWWNTVG